MTIDVATMLTATTARAEIRTDSATAGFFNTVISLRAGLDGADSRPLLRFRHMAWRYCLGDTCVTISVVDRSPILAV